MVSHIKLPLKNMISWRTLLIFGLVSLLMFLWFLLAIHYQIHWTDSHSAVLQQAEEEDVFRVKTTKNLKLPEQNELSIFLENRNRIQPKNLDLFPTLPKDNVVIVLYVHNRPQYFKAVIDSLSKVIGIKETLLIISHDGFYDEMNNIAQEIKFCRVKQIFAPYSPHIFPDRFPGVSSNDCKDKEDPVEKKCNGTADHNGTHRSVRIVSLKHHWWWMMNTVWDGLSETRNYSGHILFIEEDHFIYPNAYRNLQLLIELKSQKCPNCYAASIAPSDVHSRGERWESLIADRMGNIGYSFNRTVWRKIHKKAKDFCYFDDYNWDSTMSNAVYRAFRGPVQCLRGPRTSAVHIGKCGLHHGQGGCDDNGSNLKLEIEDIDKVPNIKSNWGVTANAHEVLRPNFQGWGGWGDPRDRQLCLEFAKMYMPLHLNFNTSSY